MLPFNSGCFALVEIPEALGIDAETARRHLLARHDTGLVSIAPRYLRIAHCSVDEAAPAGAGASGWSGGSRSWPGMAYFTRAPFSS